MKELKKDCLVNCNQLEAYLNNKIVRCDELNMPLEKWAFIQVLKEINSIKSNCHEKDKKV